MNNNFSYGYEAYPGCAMLTVGGESRDPWALREAIARTLRSGVPDQASVARLQQLAAENEKYLRKVLQKL